MEAIGKKLFPNNVALCAIVNMSLQLLCGAALLGTLALLAIYVPYSSVLFAPLLVTLFYVIAIGDDAQVEKSFKAWDKFAILAASSILWCTTMAVIYYSSAFLQNELTFGKNIGSAGLSAIVSALLAVLICILFFPLANQAHDIGKQRLAASLIGTGVMALILLHKLTGWIISGFEITFIVAAVHTVSYKILKEKLSYKTVFLYLNAINSAIITNFYPVEIIQNIGLSLTLSLILSLLELVALYFIHQLYQVNIEKCKVKA